MNFLRKPSLETLKPFDEFPFKVRLVEPKKTPAKGGFSLIEITIAIGIVSFAFVAILGLVPAGLKAFRGAINTSVGGQIFQRVINDAQQTDFSTLTNSSFPTIRYFDDQGNETNSVAGIYFVNTKVVPQTELTSTNATASTNGNLATVVVQIAYNPGKVNLGSAGANWTNVNVPILTRATMVSRNQ